MKNCSTFDQYLTRNITLTLLSLFCINMIAKIKEPIKGLYHELKLIKYTKRKSSDSAPKTATAIINLDTFVLNTDMGRFSFILCQLLKFSGFKVIIKLDKAFVKKMAPPYKQLLIKQDYTFIRSSKLPLNTIELVDETGRSRIIEIDYGYKLIGSAMDAYFFPFPLHPKFYRERITRAEFANYRNQERKVRIFFAGNSERELYNRDVLQENFKGAISRVKALDYIKEKFAGHSQMEIISDEKRFFQLFDGQASTDKFILSEVRTPGEKWLEILSKTNFFLCLPGVRMPWSHNAYESMSVGTIPIIQYGDLFTPPLEHLKNCLAYNSTDELYSVLEMALKMTEGELEFLKNNVIKYYEECLSTEVVIKKFNSFFHSEEPVLRIAIPFLEDPFLQN